MIRDEIAALIAARTRKAALARPGRCTAHVVIDGLLPPEMARTIGEAFPGDGAGFSRLRSFRERKFTSNAFDRLPAVLKDIAFALQAPEVIAAVSEATGLPALLADPTYYAGGVSVMVPGDFLNPHIDNSHNGGRTLYRRLNLLYYPNPHWRDGNGGELELWDEPTRRAVTISPRFNRLVIMETNRKSWHSVARVRRGHRSCVATYFFSPQSPDGNEYYHVTSFTGRPEQPMRRLLAGLDNRARQAAKSFGVTRGTDGGYQAELC